MGVGTGAGPGIIGTGGVSDGTGVKAYGGGGDADGIYGEAAGDGYGVFGYTQGAGAGVYGTSEGGDGYGVVGVGGYAGVWGDGLSSGYGVVAKSNVWAALHLAPQDIAPPSARMGDIYCNSAGTLHFFDGATWRVVNLT
jgi:hypothetical protein